MRGRSNDSRKKGLKKGGIKADGGHGYIERPCFVVQSVIKTKDPFYQLRVALSHYSYCCRSVGDGSATPEFTLLAPKLHEIERVSWGSYGEAVQLSVTLLYRPR